MRRRSITGPLIVILIGVVFLLNNLGRNIPIWMYVAEYWPFLLIGIGAIGLMEVLFHAGRGNQVPPRPLGGGTVFWIVAIAILAGVFGRIHRNGPSFYMVPSFWQFGAGGVSVFGGDYNYFINTQATAAGVAKIVVDNVDGNISVRGSDSDLVKVTGRQNVRAYNKGDADRANDTGAVHLDREGDTLVLRGGVPASAGMLSVTSDVEILVPKSVSVEVRGRGDLSVADVAGSVTAAKSGGDVRLSNVGRDVSVNTARGGLVRATDVGGNVDVQGRGSDIQMENIQGEVVINGEFSGTKEFRALAKPVHFESSRADFHAERIPGSVVLDLGALKVNNVAGPVRFKGSSHDVEATDVSGSLELDVTRGDVQVNVMKLPPPKMDVHTGNGDIVLSLPVNAGFEMDARTGNGAVQDFYFGTPLIARVDGRSGTITGRTGNGPRIVLTSDRGMLTVKQN